MSTVPTLSEKSAIHAIVDENVVDHFLKVLHHVVEVMFALMVVLLVLIVVHSDAHHTWGESHGRNKHNRDKDNLDGPDNNGLQINQSWIRQ